MARSARRSKNPNLTYIEHKITEARRRWLDTTSPSEAMMCERFVNRLLDRWLAVRDQDILKEKIKWD